MKTKAKVMAWLVEIQAQPSKFDIAERITWTGMLQSDLNWGAFYASEVFCPSSHQENFGIVVAEALACGQPVLISNKFNIWREIEVDRSGYIDSDTLSGTERNLPRRLEMSQSDYSSMCANAKSTFNNRFHVDRAAKTLLEII